ncbi:MAG: UDP-N-acetylmuramate dehydrogenase [Propionibacteriaceae bacterium]|jgi:UDP-N-acetylmuramate dehydrogenase|nr:UDP-N-acetylmuramate dehydrogenase [Propionibacteriaceae bacterium]
MTSSDQPSLADLTTFRIGGPAKTVVIARSESALIEAVRQADDDKEPLLIVSAGSNMLVSDEGFPGTVLVVATEGISVDLSACAGAYLTVAAGQPWDALVAHTVAQGWSGLEMLSGIPGLVGAAPIQNIGAYGAEVASVIARVRAFDRHTGQITTFFPADCRFGYRSSVFKQEPDRYVVLDVDLQLKISDYSAPVTYAELALRLGIEPGDKAPAAEARQGVLELRRGKGMVLDADDHDTWSAGSFFTNPIIGPDQATQLPTEAPQFPLSDGTVKTSAAWLIDHAGFHKGYGSGRATLSTKHVLALTNRGDASAEDVIALARTIRDGVRAAYGITLTPEPNLVGLSL